MSQNNMKNEPENTPEDIQENVRKISEIISNAFWSGNTRFIQDVMDKFREGEPFIETKAAQTIQTLSSFYIGTEDALTDSPLLLSELRETIADLVKKDADPRGVTNAIAEAPLQAANFEMRERIADLLKLTATTIPTNVRNHQQRKDFLLKADCFSREMLEKTPVFMPTGDGLKTTLRLFKTMEIAAKNLFWEAPDNGFNLDCSWVAIKKTIEGRASLFGSDAFLKDSMERAKSFYDLAANSPEPAEATQESIFALACKFFTPCITAPFTKTAEQSGPAVWSQETQMAILDVLEKGFDADQHLKLGADEQKALSKQLETPLAAPNLPAPIQGKILKMWTNLGFGLT